MQNELGLIATLAVVSLVPFIVTTATCFIKISIVLSLVRNAIGLQNVPSNMTLNGISLMLSMAVMCPIAQGVYAYLQHHPLDISDRTQLERFSTEGLGEYREFLFRHTHPSLLAYFEGVSTRLESQQAEGGVHEAEVGVLAGGARAGASDAAQARVTSTPLTPEDASLFALLPAYALSELDDAFRMGFYLYLPFVVIDLVVSSVLLALGMMMMSPVSISIPIKLVLFIAMDGWSMLGRGLVDAYIAHP
ncbi:Surface presentation of antigens protein SpaP [Pararobbsia alpina]|uniref:EscR/YscR/HrcR family type III secretion system export apparatus protein n=1 Tax=Pararobbsia alpina TaxID=621374 RepID=UPI0039A599F6